MRMDHVDFRLELLASAMSVEKNSWKARLGDWFDQCGLLQFRVVRWLLSITDDKIQEINARFRQQIDLNCLDSQKNKAWASLCEKWGVKSPNELAPPLMNVHAKAKKIFQIPNAFEGPEKAPEADLKKDGKLGRLGNLEELLRQFIKEPKKMDDISPASIDNFNARTIAMKDRLKDLPEYDDKNGILGVSGKHYRVVSSDIHQFVDLDVPLVSCGSSSSREMILFDPANSPTLQKHYQAFASLLSKSIKLSGKQLSPEDLISLTDYFISHEVFTCAGGNLEADVNAIVEEMARDDAVPKVNSQPCISIEEFLKRKSGVCRHHSLVAAYLMDRFIRHHPQDCAFEGRLQIMRDNVIGGAHAWVTLSLKTRECSV